MKRIDLAEASKPLSAYAAELEDVIVLTDHGKPVAAIVSLKDIDDESLALSTNPDFIEIIEQAREEFAACKTVSFDDMKRSFA